jgi:hypothetical protein
VVAADADGDWGAGNRGVERRAVSMSMGLYSRDVVAAWLGKRVDELERMVREDKFPAIQLPAAKRVRYKFSLSQMVIWLNERSNSRWTIAQLEAELDRVAGRMRDEQSNDEEVAA